jgi:hypothetical protein
MKKHMFKVLFALIVLISAAACNTDDPQPQLKSCLTILVGDKDGFGLGLTEGEVFHVEGGIRLPIDYRTSSDPRNTDIYPADMGTSSIPAHKIAFDMEFDPIPNRVSAATLTLFTVGVQDGDAQVVGSDEDYKLYINNQEIPKAFDGVDQFDYVDGQWSEIASLIEIEIPEELLRELESGKITVRIEINQLGSSESFDAFALDFAELTLCPKITKD